MCTRRVSRYTTCTYRFQKTLKEKLCIKRGVIAPCQIWEWLFINELPNDEPCPCRQCAEAHERKMAQQN
ncbi:hypothetical protein E4T44_09074, partial [Aureobasidium sp. EXF-8845]